MATVLLMRCFLSFSMNVSSVITGPQNMFCVVGSGRWICVRISVLGCYIREACQEGGDKKMQNRTRLLIIDSYIVSFYLLESLRLYHSNPGLYLLFILVLVSLKSKQRHNSYLDETYLTDQVKQTYERKEVLFTVTKVNGYPIKIQSTVLCERKR